jgi:molybdopterin converting factor subunit 1
MQVHVLFFGALKDLTGRASEVLDLPEHATLGDVVAHYEDINPRLNELAASIATSLNQEFAGPESPLKEGDEIAFLPPVSGGAPDSSRDGTRGLSSLVLVRERIDTQSVLDKLMESMDGAAVVFEGVVRDNTRGRRTLYLIYEAYEEMALKQMDALIRQALEQFPLTVRLPSTPAVGSSIASSVLYLSGRKSTSRMARCGPMAIHSRPRSQRLKAAIPKGPHLSEQIIFSPFLQNFVTGFVVELHFS